MAHINDLIDFTIAAFIVHEDKVLLVHHKKLDTWLPVGGHIELDEDPEQALLREIKEESGLDVDIMGTREDIDSGHIKSLIPPVYLDIHKINDEHRHIGMVYFATSKTSEVQLAEQEHNDIRWFTKEELLSDDLLENVTYYGNKALEALG
jgi:8-oxo-dGTP pyrophosphatase MutT (NUDIX family)